MSRLSAAAASQSTVFITMGADQGGGDATSTSITGTVFGLSLSSVRTGGGYGGTDIDAAGSASGQSFFRALKIGSTVLQTSAATYNSATNQWTWANIIMAPSTSYTLQCFR